MSDFLIAKLNSKVNKVRKLIDDKPVNTRFCNDFGSSITSYPALTEDTPEYWRYINNTDNELVYFRQDGLWLTKQIISTTLQGKYKVGLDMESYSYIESISMTFNVPGAILTIVKNDEDVLWSEEVKENIFTLYLNHVMMIGDYLTFNADGLLLVQIRYRLVG